MRDIKNARSHPALEPDRLPVGRRQVRTSRPFNRNGSGDGRSKKLVDTRRDELRAGEGRDGIGCHDVGKRREGNRRRRVDAMTLTRAGVTTIMSAHWGMFVGAVGRVRGTVRLRPGTGARGVPTRCASDRWHGHVRRRRSSNLKLQPDHQLKRQQNEQHSFRNGGFGNRTMSHRSELTPNLQERDATRQGQAGSRIEITRGRGPTSRRRIAAAHQRGPPQQYLPASARPSAARALLSTAAR